MPGPVWYLKVGPKRKFWKGGAQGLESVGTAWQVAPSHLNHGICSKREGCFLHVTRWSSPGFRGCPQTGQVPGGSSVLHTPHTQAHIHRHTQRGMHMHTVHICIHTCTLYTQAHTQRCAYLHTTHMCMCTQAQAHVYHTHMCTHAHQAHTHTHIAGSQTSLLYVFSWPGSSHNLI